MQITAETGAVITGGASGLGAAVARELARAGARVTIFDLNEAAGQALADDLGGAFCAVDVSDAASVRAGFAALGSTPLRIVVNCAGIAPGAKTVSRDGAHDADVFARTIAINLFGSFNVASQGAAIMAKNEVANTDGARGVVISTASVAAYEGQVGQVAYAASKGGIVAMTLPMARDLVPLGIRVVAIAPGLFKTPLLAGLPEEVQASLGGQVPFPSRLGDPGEFAALARHIVENPMLNGEVIRLDGAIRMAPR
jgi:NAD(P)-dependent dehydrogenase (short-subunit alcohol dehydrogenase family)